MAVQITSRLDRVTTAAGVAGGAHMFPAMGLWPCCELNEVLPAAGVGPGHHAWTLVTRALGVAAFAARDDAELRASLHETSSVDGCVLITAAVETATRQSVAFVARGRSERSELM